MRLFNDWNGFLARPSSPLISRGGAAEAALAVIDEVGLSSFSLARVAAKMGVQAPSLYHHFADKAALLEEVARLLLLNLPGLEKTELPYEERIITLCVSARRSLLGHPNAALLMLQFFPRNLLLAAYDEAAGSDPYPPEFHMAVIEGTEKLTFGSALFAAAAEARGIAPMPEADAEKLPRLAKALEVNPFRDEEALFVETLRIFFTGVAERYRRGSLGQPVSDSQQLDRAKTPDAALAS
ncbi:transcriptional regulator, TetR family [Caulobacter vibrioides OR37]|jgi:TetR/AcrR family tetracycline transcriptional repressor|uniref:Transcriptional regulator, TetR family n=1 Tax=Caulobacter vibrioides OR37 TaxID=1292034 RepID=R0D6K2_CAUVI|nr:transcriptional regulator, TetR family [Caulobacter vibrioides OR37]